MTVLNTLLRFFLLSNKDESIVLKLFDLLSSKLSNFRFRVRIRFMNYLRLLFAFFWSIFRLVLSLFFAYFSFSIVVTLVLSSRVAFLTVIFVSNFSIVFVFQIRNFIFNRSSCILAIISFCFIKNRGFIRFYFCLNICCL